MRNITDHIEDLESPSAITLLAVDEPGHGGANHEYLAVWPVEVSAGDEAIPNSLRVSFQNGPIKEHGCNGVTHEALLAIVIDRLRSFQAGPFPCEENAIALMCCESALRSLLFRTKRRIVRGVEGTTQA